MCRFNLTEMNFCKGQFVEAERGFRQLMNTTGLNNDNKALMNFKILICRLKQNDESGAREILKAWDYLDDHPCFYFGNAAIHFNKAEEKKARKWLNAAKKIYSPAQISLYTDSLIESGWIDNFE
jgi:Tfp pilus assembly protein PilF